MGPISGASFSVCGNLMVWPLDLTFNIIFILESGIKIPDSRIQDILKIRYQNTTRGSDAEMLIILVIYFRQNRKKWSPDIISALSREE